MAKEELVHTLKLGDYQYIFEYDTEEEFERRRRDALKTHKEVLQMELEMQLATEKREFKLAHDTLDRFANQRDNRPLSFFELEAKFIESKKKLDKVGKSTYKAWASTFNRLKSFFKHKAIQEITIDDFEAFRDTMIKEQGLKNITINLQMRYVNSFLDFAVGKKLISENNAKSVESLKEQKTVKYNYSDTEILKIINNNDYETNVQLAFKILAFTGMRVDELHHLEKSDILKEEDIYFFNIREGKNRNAVRKVPIHSHILNAVQEAKFPLFEDKTSSAMQKKILRELYKIIQKGETKTVHTFRATFMQKALDISPEKLLIVQEIVGHSKDDSASLTIDRYAKGFHLKYKKEVVETVNYVS